ncbi:unnamed protein product [Rhizoctonia solani]|uniref:DUF6532 domain-containing protein n=1 Tax=Rhizoctonia solani TaxID=456999 RepID=A0A8H3I6G3_9AGAM|nr:unnamed protein product [Rhizoctonia solani]
MSQVGPNGERRSVRSIKKTPKLKQLEEAEATEREEAEERALAKQRRAELTAQTKARRVEERERVDALQVQAEAELESAAATVQMMYNVGDLPDLDSDDPNYDLIRKIAHLTGKNYAGQGLTTEELQDTLDDPMADAPTDGGNIQDDQPSFGQFFPGITFGGTPEATMTPKPTPGASNKRQHSTGTDIPPGKKPRASSNQAPQPRTPTTRTSLPRTGGRTGSTVSAEAASRYPPLTRTDRSTFHGGTPSHPHRPPPPPSQASSSLVRTDTATIIGGTPQRPIQAKRASGLRILGSQSQPSPLPSRPTVRNSSTAASKAATEPTPARSASFPTRPRHTSPRNPPGSDTTPSHPGSLAPSTHGSPHTGDSGHPKGPQPGLTPRNPSPGNGNGSERLISNAIAQGPPRTPSNTAHTGPPSSSCRSNPDLVARYNQVRTELKAELAVYNSLVEERDPAARVSPEILSKAVKIRKLRERFKELARLTQDSPAYSTPTTISSTETNPQARNSQRETVFSNGSSSHASNAQNSPTSRDTAPPAPNPPTTTPRNSTNMQRDAQNAKQRAVNRSATHDKDDDEEGGGDKDESESEGEGEGESNGDGSGNANVDDDLGDGKDLDEDTEDEARVRRGVSARSEREQANKPILTDFPREDANILKLAKHYAMATLLSRGIFKYLPTDAGPELEDEAYVYKDAWKLACQETGVTRRYRTIFGKWMKQRRSAFIHESAIILKGVVDEYLGFSTTNPKRNMNISKARIDGGCHREPDGYAFHSPLLRQGIRALVFDDARAYGITHEDLFSCIPFRLIAYTTAILHYVINGYRKGHWANDRMNATTQGAFFRQFLKEYDHEENFDKDRQAYGERYRERIYELGRVAYDSRRPIDEDPMPALAGGWGSDMELDADD